MGLNSGSSLLLLSLKSIGLLNPHTHSDIGELKKNSVSQIELGKVEIKCIP